MSRKDDRDIEVSDDHILLSNILADHEVTVKQVAMLTGRAMSTIYKYCSGESTIPSVVWRVLYKLTRDERITGLITGDVPVMMVALAKTGKGTAADLGRMIEARQEEIDFEKRVLKILADGEVNEKDRADIAKLKTEFPKMITSLSRIFQAITDKYNGA